MCLFIVNSVLAQKVDISALGPAPLFSLGMNVIVSRRKQANINQEGGAAEVTAVRYDEECEYLYDVQYVIRRGTEKGLMESFLQPVDSTPVKRRCALSAGVSSPTGNSVSAFFLFMNGC